MSGQPRVRPDPALGLLEIYDAALPQVHGYLLSRCRDRTLAQDLTAETFLAAVTAVRQQPTPPITTGWLIGVARHKLADHWRWAAREQRGLRLAHAASDEADDPWDVEIDTVLAHQVLDALGPHHRAALTLREPITPVDPDPAFAAELRSRLERALLAPEGAPMTTTVETPSHTLGCYIAVNDARSALSFYELAFGARRRGEPIVMDDGRVGHAELAIGDSVLMLADEFAEIGLLSPRTRGGPSQSLYLRVSEPGAVDAIVRDAVEAGARLERAAADHDYGRNAVVVDPSGHRWMISSSPAATPTPRHGDLAYLTHAVADTARAREFYGAVLGWTFRPGRVEDGWQIEGTYPPAGMHGSADPAGIEPVYQVDDLAAALATVRDHGGQAGEPQQHPYGRIAACTDNQGVHFQLLQRRPAGTRARSRSPVQRGQPLAPSRPE